MSAAVIKPHVSLTHTTLYLGPALAVQTESGRDRHDFS